MKKILSAILSAAIIAASAAVPVFADYVKSDYDIERINMTFDDGTETGADGTNALKLEAYTEKIFHDTSLDTTKEFILSFDFRMDSADALIEIPKYKSSGVDKVGPRLTIADGNLVTETSKGPQSLGACSAGEWYAAEIEGRTGMGEAYTTFRLYKYEGASRELVETTTSFNMRNLSSEGRSLSGMGGTNVTLDNIKLISLNPDVLTVTSDADSVNAGQTITMDYEMSRQDVVTTKHAVTWKVFDESGTNEITDGSVSITETGILVANISSASKKVTVKALATFQGETLIGEKQISIISTDTSDEVFDTIVINGDDKVKAGTSITFTVSASKSGQDITPSESDVVWSLYNGEDVAPYSNNNVTINNGVLTVADGVIAHDICVRASSVSGKVYGSKKISIEFGASQIDNVIFSDAFETSMQEENKTVSIDGSQAYLATADYPAWNSTNRTGYTLVEMDIKFTKEGAGFVLMRRDAGKTNTQVTYSGGNIKTYSGMLMQGADTDTWYHVELLYSKTDSASCNIYPYNQDGTLGDAVKSLGINKRNSEDFGLVRVYAGTCIDNVKVSEPAANEITVKAPSSTVFAGETAQFTATVSRNGLPFDDASGITWSVLDESGLPILGDAITVNDNGLLTVTSMASAGTVTVRASASQENYGDATITVAVAEIFTVDKIGKNKDGDKIVRIYANKNFYYDDDVLFILAVKDENGVLKAVKLIKTFGDRLQMGENEIATDLDLPADFDPGKDKIEVMIWTAI